MGESYPALFPTIPRSLFREAHCPTPMASGLGRIAPFLGGHTLRGEYIFPQGETISQMLTENVGSMTYGSPTSNLAII